MGNCCCSGSSPLHGEAEAVYGAAPVLPWASEQDAHIARNRHGALQLKATLRQRKKATLLFLIEWKSSNAGCQAAWTAHVHANAHELVFETERGQAVLRCTFANVAALQLWDGKQAILRFLASSCELDPRLRAVFHDAVVAACGQLQCGHFSSAQHFVPGDCGGGRYFPNVKVSPVLIHREVGAAAAPDPGFAPGATHDRVAAGTASEASVSGGRSNGFNRHDDCNGLQPALVVELDALREDEQLAARLQRDCMLMSHIPSIVTMFDGATGRVLHQNSASIAFMGIRVRGVPRVAGSGQDAAGGSGAAPPQKAHDSGAGDAGGAGESACADALGALFALQPEKGNQALRAAAEGRDWRGVVKMPARLLLSAPAADPAAPSLGVESARADVGVPPPRTQADALAGPAERLGADQHPEDMGATSDQMRGALGKADAAGLGRAHDTAPPSAAPRSLESGVGSAGYGGGLPSAPSQPAAASHNETGATAPSPDDRRPPQSPLHELGDAAASAAEHVLAAASGSPTAAPPALDQIAHAAAAATQHGLGDSIVSLNWIRGGEDVEAAGKLGGCGITAAQATGSRPPPQHTSPTPPAAPAVNAAGFRLADAGPGTSQPCPVTAAPQLADGGAQAEGPVTSPFTALAAGEAAQETACQGEASCALRGPAPAPSAGGIGAVISRRLLSLRGNSSTASGVVGRSVLLDDVGRIAWASSHSSTEAFVKGVSASRARASSFSLGGARSNLGSEAAPNHPARGAHAPALKPDVLLSTTTVEPASSSAVSGSGLLRWDTQLSLELLPMPPRRREGPGPAPPGNPAQSRPYSDSAGGPTLDREPGSLAALERSLRSLSSDGLTGSLPAPPEGPTPPPGASAADAATAAWVPLCAAGVARSPSSIGLKQDGRDLLRTHSAAAGEAAPRAEGVATRPSAIGVVPLVPAPTSMPALAGLPGRGATATSCRLASPTPAPANGGGSPAAARGSSRLPVFPASGSEAGVELSFVLPKLLSGAAVTPPSEAIAAVLASAGSYSFGSRPTGHTHPAPSPPGALLLGGGRAIGLPPPAASGTDVVGPAGPKAELVVAGWEKSKGRSFPRGPDSAAPDAAGATGNCAKGYQLPPSLSLPATTGGFPAAVSAPTCAEGGAQRGRLSCDDGSTSRAQTAVAACGAGIGAGVADLFHGAASRGPEGNSLVDATGSHLSVAMERTAAAAALAAAAASAGGSRAPTCGSPRGAASSGANAADSGAVPSASPTSDRNPVRQRTRALLGLLTTTLGSAAAARRTLVSTGALGLLLDSSGCSPGAPPSPLAAAAAGQVSESGAAFHSPTCSPHRGRRAAHSGAAPRSVDGRPRQPGLAGGGCSAAVGAAPPALAEVEAESEAEGAEGAEGDGGSIRWHEVLVRPSADPVTGQPVVVVVQTDVTNQVCAEVALVSALEAEHRLLSDILPVHVLAHMTATHRQQAAARAEGDPRAGLQMLRHIQDPAALATSHESITVLFADIKGFTEMSKEVPPAVVMTFLNNLYTRFDSLTDVYGVYKVETIGDCYMVAGGLVARDGDGYGRAVRGRGDTDPLAPQRVVAFARAMLEEAEKVALPNTGEPVQLRIGIHSGPATSGVVGQKMPRFCLFGDTINTASRMESTGRPGAVHVSAATRGLLAPYEDEKGWAPTGGVVVKGKGRMDTFLWAPETAEASRWRSGKQQRAMLLGTLSTLGSFGGGSVSGQRAGQPRPQAAGAGAAATVAAAALAKGGGGALRVAYGSADSLAMGRNRASASGRGGGSRVGELR